MSSLPPGLSNLIPIALLLGTIALVLARLPKVELGHSAAFKSRRFWNWFPLGLCYAFLYFGRYNINEATSALGTLVDNAAFGTVFAVGAWVYGCAFLINGPLTDWLGGRKTILAAVLGAAAANLALGSVVWVVLKHGWQPPGGLLLWLCALYGVNMYFQSFGAVSIVKVNASWFHLRERGVQGGVFGILISLGIYFGYDWSRMIVQAAPSSPYFAFYVPALCLIVLAFVGALLIRDNPSDAGHQDFDVADASSDASELVAVQSWPGLARTLGPAVAQVATVFAKVFRNPTILTIVAIEFCTGFLRNGVMSWYPKFAKSTGVSGGFVATNWGLLLCVFGIVGGMFAGVISDRIFNSRRGPVASVLYAGISVGAVAMALALQQPWLGWILVFMALNYVGVHGMLSGTASADFGGRKNAGVAVGIIDGFVYLGTGLQSLLVGQLLPSGGEERVASNWIFWPLLMLPVAFIGLFLCTRVWNATPRRTPPNAEKPSVVSDAPRAELKAG
ncbi:MAG: MFS transporter [Myxococcaceae bacterium]